MKLKKALKFFNSKDYDLIVSRAKAMQPNAQNSEWLNVVAAACLKTDRFVEAIFYLDVALKKSPLNLAIINNFSEACIRIAKPELAAEKWKTVVRNKLPELYLPSYANFLYKSGRLNEAVETLRMCSDSNKQPPIYYELMAKILLQTPFLLSRGKIERWQQSHTHMFEKSLTVKTMMIIKDYIDGHVSQCVQGLSILTSPEGVENYKNLNKIDKQFVGAYVKFIANLIKHRTTPTQNINAKLVYCVGESHCLTYHRQIFNRNEAYFEIFSKLVLGVKIYHLIGPDFNEYKALVKENIAKLAGASVILAFGEIDFRENEGLLTSKVADKLLEAEKMALSYLSLVRRYKEEFGLKPIVLAVPFPLQQRSESHVDYALRLGCIKVFNKTLHSNHKEFSIGFLDSFSVVESNGADGCFHLDNRHYSPRILHELSNIIPI